MSYKWSNVSSRKDCERICNSCLNDNYSEGTFGYLYEVSFFIALLGEVLVILGLCPNINACASQYWIQVATI